MNPYDIRVCLSSFQDVFDTEEVGGSCVCFYGRKRKWCPREISTVPVSVFPVLWFYSLVTFAAM